MSRGGRWLALIIVALAAGLRFHGMAGWSLDGDELYTWWDVRRLLEEGIWAEGARSHPLSYAGIAGTVKLLGFSEGSLRLFPSICGVLAVLALLVMRRDVLSAPVALAAATLAAFSPWLVYHSQEARFYGPLMLFASLATLWALPGKGQRRLLALAAFTCALLCHPSALPLGAGLLLPWLLPPVERRRLSLTLLGVAGVLVFLLIQGSTLSLVQRALSEQRLTSYDSKAFVLGLGYGLSPGVGLLALLGLRRCSVCRDDLRWTLAACAFLPLGLMLLGSLAGVSMHQRYAMAAVPALLLLAALPVAQLVVTGRRWVGVALIVLALGLQWPALRGLLADGDRHDWRSAARWIARTADPGDIFVVDEHSLLELYLVATPSFAAASIFEAPVEGAARLAGIANNRRDSWVVLKASRLASMYGEEFMSWVEEHYVEAARFGHPPPRFARHDNSLVVFHRQEGGS